MPDTKIPAKEEVITALLQLPGEISNVKSTLNNLNTELSTLSRNFIAAVTSNRRDSEVNIISEDIRAKQNIIGQMEITYELKKDKFQAMIAISNLIQAEEQ